MKTKVGFLLTSPQLQPLDGLFTACVHTLSVHLSHRGHEALEAVSNRVVCRFPPRGGMHGPNSKTASLLRQGLEKISAMGGWGFEKELSGERDALSYP